MARSIAAAEILSKTWTFLLDVVYPPRCGGCNLRGTLFCGDCLRSMARPSPGAHSVERIEALMAAGVFGGPLRSAIHKLKYEGDTTLARPLARFISDVLERDGRWVADDGEPTVIVPVPLHKDKQRARGFNQSEMLARELARMTGWAIDRRLVRVKATRSQVGLSADERADNVRDAFRWLGEDGSAPTRVLLVDDVCTTGATLSECAFVLLSQGTEHVFAATVAKAVGDSPAADT